MKKKCMLAVGMLLVLSMLSGCGAKKDGPMDQVQENSNYKNYNISKLNLH